MKLEAPELVYRQAVEARAPVHVTGAIELATSVTDFHLHLLWGSDGAMHLIVEGDRRPSELGDLIADQLGTDWKPSWIRVEDADKPPNTLEAGQQSAWVIEMALGPDDPRCDGCERVIPPHRKQPPCPFDGSGGGMALGTRIPRHGGSGGDLEIPDPVREEVDARVR
jgi:hypothetical protein